MSNGTILNNVFCPRLHKSNAAEAQAEAEEMLAHYKDTLLTLAAATPDSSIDGLYEIQREVDVVWQEMQEQAVKAWLAGYIVDSPEDCKDELVAADWEGEDEQD